MGRFGGGAKAVLRGVGWVLLLIAALVVAYGLFVWVGGVPIFELTVGEHWFVVHSDSLGLAQAGVQRHLGPLGPGLWENVVVEILLWPVAGGVGLIAAVFAVPGILMVTLIRRRRRRLMRR